MSKVVTITGGKIVEPVPAPTSAAEADPNIVKFLEDILEQARKGEILAMALVGCDDEGPAWDAYIGSGRVELAQKVIGGMELCKHTMLMAAYEEMPGKTVG